MTTDYLDEATSLIRAGKIAEAQEILHPFIRANPQNVDAWLLETETWNTAGKIRVLQICLEHNPGNTRAQQALKDLLTAHQERLLRLGQRRAAQPASEAGSRGSGEDEGHPADGAPADTLSAKLDHLTREVEQSQRLMEQVRQHLDRVQADVNSLREDMAKLEAEPRQPE